MLKQTALLKLLHDRWRRFKCCQRVFDSFFPIGMRQVAPQCDAAASPAKRGKTAHFQKKLAILLAKFCSLAPIMNFQTWNDCMLGQGSWIQQPGIGNYFL